MVTGAGQRDEGEWEAPFAVQVLGVWDRVVGGTVSAFGARTMPSATAMAAIAWN